MNKEIARTPQDFCGYFSSLINLNFDKSQLFLKGISDFTLAGKARFRQTNIPPFALKIVVKPSNQVVFKIAFRGSHTAASTTTIAAHSESRRLLEFFLQTLIFLFTVK